MIINMLELKNFRCFESLKMEFHSKCNILIGNNGAGKSAVLDGLAVALGGYLLGFNDIRSNSISSKDVRYKMISAGSRIEPQEQFPVGVYARGTVRDKGEEISIEWVRELNSRDGRTTVGGARPIADYAQWMQERVRWGDKTCVLPLIAYYGTGRLWLQRKKNAPRQQEQALKRQMGYVGCITAESNEKQMIQWFEEMTYIQLQEGKKIAELEVVKKALRECYMSADKSIIDAQFSFNVKSRELEIQIERKELTERLPVRMLSDGEKGVISLVADIAYRMALLNPDLLGRALEAPGVVLIDEVDLHLHPAWQKKIVGDLLRIFPNIQFIMTTHSPSILVNVPRENIWILNHYKMCRPQSTTYGRSVEEVLREVMDINVRPDEVLTLQKEFDEAIDREDYETAKKCLDKMKNKLGEHAQEVIENQITLDVEM